MGKRNWNFKISTGLKNLIGRELITNEFIAIFELVKNSYDAGARKVIITFDNIYDENSKITISDNGHGMNESDIQEKWLFVAYSEKVEGKRTGTYRDNFSERVYAGAKGVGRFSCDRLGRKLKLFSRKTEEKNTNYIDIDWADFEIDSKEEFINVPVKNGRVASLPSGFEHGTTIEISELRGEWNRQTLIDLKKSLSKMVNPDAELSKDDQFNIYIVCNEEKEDDELEKRRLEEAEEEIDISGQNIVNGKVANYVFETLNIKTTQIKVGISEDGESITTSMYDRGTFLFELQQKNPFFTLRDVKIRLFQLNRAAKINFRKIMGIPPIQYGSIFIYKNGFRIMPYGEPGNDVFGIDRRKAQGFKRNLGTRDLMGRIEIYGSSDYLRETTSRDGGFIKTATYYELVDLFIQYALKPLEKYVVGLISWGDPDKVTGKVVEPESIRKEILNYITEYEKSSLPISVSCNPYLFEIVDDKREKAENKNIKDLKKMAKQLNSEDLQILAQKIEKHDKKQEREKEVIAKKAEEVSEKLNQTERELEATHRQALFLRNLANPKYENAVESLHTINTYAKSIKGNLDKIIKDMRKWEGTHEHEVITKRLFEIVKATQKISSIYNIACHADYDIKKGKINDNIVDFMREYIEGTLLPRTGEILNIEINGDSKEHILYFSPMEFGILIDNIIYNSVKAKAHNITIDIYGEEKEVIIDIVDDGNGLNSNISEPDKIFELGYTTTNGSGIGLAHVKKIAEEMGGRISIDTNVKSGFKVEMRIKQ
ncbi:MAG: GHKL domain-containing protein [Lachnospiraceae bacterium]|nr:GHKL domain-containing protein [Lachnospiraceae bacterium]